jgi:CubicO group peptidase (beta-lactamase class C family)
VTYNQTAAMTRRTFLAFTAPVMGAGFASPAPRTVRPIQSPAAWFLMRLPQLMEVSGTPGIAAVIIEKGRVVWDHYAGVLNAADPHGVTRDTMWPAASLGKPVFAAAALGLVSDGTLNLDRPLCEYLPNHAASDPRTTQITARHVLSHTSGLPNWRTRVDQPLVADFDPGSRFSYSGEGYYFLQRTVEHLTGLGIQEFVRERIFAPLTMTSSTYTWRADVPARLVAPHDRGIARPSAMRDFSTRLLAHAESRGKSLDGYTSEDARAAMGDIADAPPPLPVFMIPNVAGSLLTTPLDYARFVTAMLDPSGAALRLSKTGRDAMTVSQVALNSAMGWSLGWGLETGSDSPVLWHWGDNGNSKNFVLIDPRSASAVVVFTNSNHGMNVAQRLVSAATGEDHVSFQWL